MTTKSWLITGVAGIALLCGAGAVVVTWAEGPASALPKSAARPGAAYPSGQPLAAPGVSAAAGPASPSQLAPAPPEPAAPAAQLAPRDSLEEKVRALEPLRQEVFAGLASLDPRVERCRLGDADLLLTLETANGSVRVVEVQVAAAGRQWELHYRPGTRP